MDLAKYIGSSRYESVIAIDISQSVPGEEKFTASHETCDICVSLLFMGFCSKLNLQ